MKNFKKLVQQNKVYWIVLAIVLILSFIVMILGSILSHNSIIKVSHIGTQDDATVVRQNFLVEFKRPMTNLDVEEYIHFEPNLAFKTHWNGRILVIKPTEKLKSLSQYSLKIDKEIEDIFGGTLPNDYNYSFTTKSQFLYYTKGDNVIRYDLIRESEEIVYESKKPILTLNAFENSMVLRIDDPSHAKALYIDTESGFEKELFDSSEHISLTEISPDGKYVWALSQEIYQQDDFKLPIGKRILFRYNVRTDTSEEYDISNRIESVDSFSFTPDSKSLLIEESYSNAFSLMDISSKELVSVGKYIASRGFNQKGDKALFIDLNWSNLQEPSWIVLKDNDGESILKEEGLSAIDPLFINEDLISFSSEYRLLENLRAMYDVVIFENMNEINRIHIDEYSLEYAQMSEDGQYLFLRGYTEEQLLQPYDFYEREGSIPSPVYYSLFIYNLENSEIIHIGDSIISSN